MSGEIVIQSTPGNGDDGEYSLGEARRQINALWKKYTEMFAETVSNGKELAQIRAQNDYIVKLLEKIDASNQLALPRCAERGVMIDETKRTSDDNADEISEIKPRLEKLEATSRVLKWIATIISGVLIVIITKYLNL